MMQMRMAKPISSWPTLLFLFFVLFPGAAVAAQTLIPAPPRLAANAYLLVDADSGKVIVEHNSSARVEPASLTKKMTAYIAAHELHEGNIRMTDQVRVSKKAWQMGGSKMFIRVGTEVTVDELLHGIIIQSGNDASVAMAEHIAGAEDAFVQIMNHHAGLLGMSGTHFQNAHGWPAENHYTTARDMAVLAKAIIYRYPDHYALYKVRNYTYNGIAQPNRNRLLWQDDSVDGLKTGHTEAAGYCLVASAKRGDMRLISVVMGAKSEDSRARETRKLLAYGFRYYETIKPYEAGAVLNETRIWGGTVDKVRLGVSEDMYLTIPRGRAGDLEASLEVERIIRAPINAGDARGSVKVRLDSEPVADVPLVALDSVPEGGLVKRILDWVKLFFLDLFNMLKT